MEPLLRGQRSSPKYTIDIQYETVDSSGSVRSRPRAVLRICDSQKLSAGSVREDSQESFLDRVSAHEEDCDINGKWLDTEECLGYCDQSIIDEESYMLRNTTKADRKAGTAGGSVRASALSRTSRRREKAERRNNAKPRAARRFQSREKRKEEHLAQLTARKERIRSEFKGNGYSCWAESLSQSPPSGDLQTGDDGYSRRRRYATSRPPPSGELQTGGDGCSRRRRYTAGGHAVEVLSAGELGIESGAMYNRLLRILEGDEITPEDFELLVQLDSKNPKSTMKESDISELELVTVRTETCNRAGRDDWNSFNEYNISRDELGDGHCVICLSKFENLADGAQLRRLPCQHMFCRECIDQWLAQNSARCPNLSCFWSLENGSAP